MLEPDNPSNPDPNLEAHESGPELAAPRKARPRKAAAKKAVKKAVKRAAEPAAAEPAAADPAGETATESTPPQPASTARPRKRAAKKAAPAASDASASAPAGSPATEPEQDAPKRRRAPRKKVAPATPPDAGSPESGPSDSAQAEAEAPAASAASVLFVAPSEAPRSGADSEAARSDAAAEELEEPDEVREAAAEEATGARRRRRRGRRGRGSRGGDVELDSPATSGEQDQPVADRDAATRAKDGADGAAEPEPGAEETGDEAGPAEPEEGTGTSSSARRRRRRRRRSADEAGESGESGDAAEGPDDPPDTVVHVRESRDGRGSDDGVRGVKGSTRLEAKRQRRRDGRESGRRRPPILTEAEFLARRESVDRVMAVRQNGDRTQIGVLEDDILVEHYVTRASATSYVGNVYLGRVQNVLPSMEAAFIDIGKGRNGVLYAGEVNWDAAGLEGKSRAIEQALNPGDTVLVQVTKDPIAHKGARLTSQISLPGRFLVYVPGGGMTGISRKLPDTERHRLKTILKKIVPEDGGVIIRTAAEGASEADLTHDVERLTAEWAAISAKAGQKKSAPTLVHGEPDLAIRVVRDVFNEDFARLVVQGEDAWKTVSSYVRDVAPDLADRVSRHTGEGDLFHELRVDEQLTKALDRKVYLPSGGSLVIDRTEAMTVIDVNTGKFVGSGGNLEQTVTRNNLEAAEEIVRQLRLRDIGGIVVIDFIDMVLESNRELVLRRLTECLGRDRTKHQVAEVTSLGLVQMTRKRVGEGLLQAFSEVCPTCNGRGVLVHSEPVDGKPAEAADGEKPSRRKGKRAAKSAEPAVNDEQRRAAASAMAAIAAAHHEASEQAALEAMADGGVIEVTADGVARVVDVATEEPAEAPAPPKRERRRAATRPAGPPVAVNE